MKTLKWSPSSPPRLGEGTKQLLSTRSADCALLARLEEISWKLTKLEGLNKNVDYTKHHEEVRPKQLFSINADSAVLERLEEMSSKLTKLEGLNRKMGLGIDHTDYTIEHKLQGIPQQGSTNLVHKGFFTYPSRLSPLFGKATICRGLQDSKHYRLSRWCCRQ